MLWPTDSALRALSPDRQAWLYHEDHRDKLAAILRGHIIRNIEVGAPQTLVPTDGHPACLPRSNHDFICSGLGVRLAQPGPTSHHVWDPHLLFLQSCPAGESGEEA